MANLNYIGYNLSYGGVTAHPFAYLLIGITDESSRYYFGNKGTYLFMTWTADNGLAPLVRLLYDQQQIKTFSQ